jgi:hypothetical protein
MKYVPHSNITFVCPLELKERVIPYGDYFTRSCTVKNYSYFETITGWFKKLHQSINIERIDQIEFNLAYELRETFTFMLSSPSSQAGLTRGYKVSFAVDTVEDFESVKREEFEQKLSIYQKQTKKLLQNALDKKGYK